MVNALYLLWLVALLAFAAVLSLVASRRRP
jgi:hypothetical protein